MRQTIAIRDIRVVAGITQGTASPVSVKAIMAGEGAHAIPTVKHYSGGKFALVFGLNHLYAAKELGHTEMEVEIVL